MCIRDRRREIGALFTPNYFLGGRTSERASGLAGVATDVGRRRGRGSSRRVALCRFARVGERLDRDLSTTTSNLRRRWLVLACRLHHTLAFTPSRGQYSTTSSSPRRRGGHLSWSDSEIGPLSC